MVLIRTTKPCSDYFRPLGSTSEGIHSVFVNTYQRRVRVSVEGVGVATWEAIEGAWNRVAQQFKDRREKEREKVNWKKEGF